MRVTPRAAPAAALPRLSRLAVRRLGAALLAAGALSGCLSLDERQRQWIFQPARQAWWGGAGGIEGIEPVWIVFTSEETGREARLNGLWLPAASPDSPVLLYLHGARWDVTGSARRMARMRELGFSVLGIDYRGFGKSSDELPSERMAYEDARAAWRWLAEQHPDAPRYIFGHSLGAAVAVDLASEASDAAGLIVEGGFTSIPAVYSSMRFGWLPLQWLITQRFDAAQKIERIRMPLLVVHGSEDRLIVPALGRALYERAPSPKRFVLVDGGSHHNTNALAMNEYRSALHELFGFQAVD
jgi:alpha-beta hydrolase superfamily lysophospholipase